MENNAAIIVDSLLSKFGTTIEKLIPSIVEFGRYDCQLTIRVCSYLIVVGIIFIALGLIVTRRYVSDGIGTLLLFLGILGTVMIIVYAFIIVIAIATLNEWNAFPEIMAYKYILSCVN